MIGLVSPLLSLAHGSLYLEFNPDKSSLLKDADVDTPSQVFYAQNDFLGGFDIWVANPGSAGTATFELLNEQGGLTATKTVSIPTIAITSSGTKLHVDFNSQFSVLAGNKYTLRILSSMPQLRLYYSDRVQLISYNGPFVSEYIIGVAKLGAEEQPFSFKYALYETNETSAPIVSNVAWTVVSGTQMRVDFNTNEAVDSRIEYGLSGQGYSENTNFLNDYKFCTDGINLCSITIPVSPNQTYQYLLTVRDSWGNQSQVTGTFQSGQSQTPTPSPSGSASPSPTVTPTSTVTSSPTATPNPNAPVISNLRTVFLDNNSTGIAWTTNIAANSSIVISREFDFSLIIKSIADSTLELEHLLQTDEILSPGTTYAVRVKSANPGGETTASISFTTLAQPSPTPTPPPPPPTPSGAPASPTPAPLPSNIIITSSRNGGDSVGWNPPAGGEPSDGYRIDIIDKNGNLVKTILVKDSHSADIPELKEGDSVIVYANNDGVFEKIDKPVQLKKTEPPFIKRLLAFWWALIPLVAALGYLLWRNFQKKASSSAPSGGGGSNTTVVS